MPYPPAGQTAAQGSVGNSEALLGSSEEGSRDAKPAKRGRRSNPKVKTGCANCKYATCLQEQAFCLASANQCGCHPRRRRIKCDERRPACTQCVKSNKVCTGYPPPSRHQLGSLDIRIAPKLALAAQPQSAPDSANPAVVTQSAILLARRVKRRHRPSPEWLQKQLTTSSPTVYQPSHGLSFPQLEGQYFELFRVQTAAELSGYFASDFWARRVLQECHSQPTIRHSVVALGALYKTLEESFQLKSASKGQSQAHTEALASHWQVAIRQYSEACNAARLLRGDNVGSYRTRLMSNVLLACFDSFVGDHKQAIIQIQTGLSLLHELQSQYSSLEEPNMTSRVEDELFAMFTRLAVQAKSYDMAFHFPRPYVIRLTPIRAHGNSSEKSSRSPSPLDSITLPARFEHLVEARLASDKLCFKLLCFIERLQIAKNNASNVLPADWKRYGMNLKGEIDAWSAAFEPILQSRHESGKPIVKVGIAALKMFQINVGVLFMMMFCDSELQFDAFIPQFKQMVDLGWEVVSAEALQHGSRSNIHGSIHAGQLKTPRIKPSFSADLGIVPPLFVVVTKCREPRIRRNAIGLLRSTARREGMYDSELVAIIGEWIMGIEEGGMSGQSTSVPIPEEKRVMIKSVDFDLRARYADIRVGTRAIDAGPDDRYGETRITW